MKIRVADYIAQKCYSMVLMRNFSVVGGGAMHLNDSLGHHK